MLQGTRTAVRSQKVLLVDDSAFTRRLIRGMLKDLGFASISEAPNGAVAEKLLKTHRFDAILVDWRMPVVDGATFLANLRANSNAQTAMTPVIVISAHVDLPLLQKAADLGARSVIVKPFSIAVLKSHIDAATGGVELPRGAPPPPVAPAAEEDPYEIVYL